MNPSTAARLVEINRDFYARFGDSFSATRRRLQPGVRRLLEQLKGDESILDLGCGNGELARELARRGHHGPYLGLDFSRPLLREAESLPEGFSAKFLEVDLTQLAGSSEQCSVFSEQYSVFSNQLSGTEYRPLNTEHWLLITAFAVLHHIPSTEMRLNLLRVVHKLLKQDGMFALSNWQFLNSAKLKTHIQPWEAVGLSASEVDPGDYLLDWRSHGKGLRYVHHFSQAELDELANAGGFRVADTYSSDGEGGRLGLYQIWEPIP